MNQFTLFHTRIRAERRTDIYRYTDISFSSSNRPQSLVSEFASLRPINGFLLIIFNYYFFFPITNQFFAGFLLTSNEEKNHSLQFRRTRVIMNRFVRPIESNDRASFSGPKQGPDFAWINFSKSWNLSKERFFPVAVKIEI